MIDERRACLASLGEGGLLDRKTNGMIHEAPSIICRLKSK